MSHADESHLVISVEGVEAGRIFGQLHADILAAQEDTLQPLPLALYICPGRKYSVDCAQLLLPVADLLQESWVALHKLSENNDAGEAVWDCVIDTRGRPCKSGAAMRIMTPSWRSFVLGLKRCFCEL